MVDLRTARQTRNLTQRELGQLLELSEVIICRYERRHAIPRPATRRAIEGLLGPIDWIHPGQPLTNAEQQKLFQALKTAGQQLGSYEEAVALFAGKAPDEVRTLIKILLDTDDEKKLLPPNVKEK